ncbi:DNA polymerase III subunit gamma/tau [Caviibacter abscessus]|uniref:DNA polymerase III subunit gamma/tau n=1 Tax=Caviibacter abscessus TaxID=1766719 RepID=UPI00082A79C7|nr:DNA polymerase III subunit gamma/tau [Caviibacter abscessus]
MNLTLYRKYRPESFENVFGQEHIKRAISNALKENKLSHAYLFNGPRGVGKTTIARLIAKSVNCLVNGISDKPCMECENCIEIANGSSLDVIEIDAASNRGIQEIRQLKENIQYQPVKCRKKVYIIDEVHMLTKEAFNALLKTLEEPPEHVIFILATTEIDKIPDTIISRCGCYDFKILSKTEILDMLSYCVSSENININNESLELVYLKSGGSARDSFSILEKLISTYIDEDITLEKTQNALGIIPITYLEKFYNILLENNKQEAFNFIDVLYKNAFQIDVFFKDFCDYLKENEQDINKKIRDIGIIYKNINEFKYEDDKRILAYVLVYELFNLNYTVITGKNDEKKQKKTNESKEDFSYEKLLDHLINQGQIFYNNVLREYRFVKFEDDTVFITPISDFKYASLILSNEEHIRIIEEEIFNLYNRRFNLSVTNNDSIKNKDKDIEFNNTVVNLFSAQEI